MINLNLNLSRINQVFPQIVEFDGPNHCTRALICQRSGNFVGAIALHISATELRTAPVASIPARCGIRKFCLVVLGSRILQVAVDTCDGEVDNQITSE